ncbi:MULTISPECIES: DUF6719 family protein [Bradyrhizobium]|jgi:hypothetical protein|uniref:DUF6719 family protein n=1 Tax=Bradyrhizobium TaxID=374 RepID=UPI00041C1792|nr:MULTISPECIES: DUF6719 family protein [Bradyrhizobium]KIU45975.1 hypothetical protein QU41_24315 [Bradyrhizobium elkanii]OCX26990.1 hypothetical protein QU42_30120 [Bradyrhizobium sp. UASWS1016]
MPRIALVALVSAAAFVAMTYSASAQQALMREGDIVDLRVGQRVLIDDGSCPAGQIKQVVGSKLSQNGVVRTHSCVPRLAKK